MAFSVLGCVLGAGFLSGAEIYSFFVRFGYYGVVGAIVCASLFGFIVYAVTSKRVTGNLANLSMQASGVKNGESKIMQICGLVIAGTMVAGTNNIIIGFGCNAWLSNILVFLCLYVALVLGLKFAKAVNICVTAVSLVFVIAIVNSSFINHYFADGVVLNVNFANCFLAIIFAVSYACMNAISSYTILSGLSVEGKGNESVSWVRRRCRSIGIWCGVILATLILIIYSALVAVNAKGQMPLVGLINNGFVKVMYCSLLVVAMLSTMFSCGLGGQKLFIQKWGKGYSCLVVSLLCQVISFAGFGNLVSIGYPLIGAIVAAKFVINFFANRKSKAKRQKNAAKPHKLALVDVQNAKSDAEKL